MFSWDSIPRPILALAPMAGYTDSSYRQLVKEVCPSVVCFTEFTNVDGILHGNEATMRQVSFDPNKERPIVAQIFGRKPENFRKAAAVLTKLGVDAIDINMGCPAKKIVSSDHGSALLKNPSLSEEIVRATVEGTHLPVSIKMRIGTSCYDPDYFFSFAESMERAGAKLITIHGRTSKQMYSGLADWTPMYELKKILKIPVIGNGDIKNGKDAASKLKNLDGLMVGRGTFGNPWIFCEILAAFAGKPYQAPTLLEKLPTIARHLELSCQFKGEKWGILEMRKHLAWYIRGIPHASELRCKLVTVTSQKETMAILETNLLATPPAVSPV
ncbi:MAG: tRNA-dihydrouridine synthase [Patescibacteria group bacterium]